MEDTFAWIRKRKSTLGLAIFFLIWYVIEMFVFRFVGEDAALWWFYFQQPPDLVSPGLLLAPISHDLYTLKHIGANLAFLIFAGGLAEPYVGKTRVLVLVVVFGYVGTYIANATIAIHQLWMVAGASGGILALWSYAGLQMRQRASEYLSQGIILSRRSVETTGFVALLIGIPFILLHQIFWVSEPHSGHIIGIALGCTFYLAESRSAKGLSNNS